MQLERSILRCHDHEMSKLAQDQPRRKSAFVMKINEECLPSLTLKSRGSGSYMGDVCKCSTEFWQESRATWWGGMDVEVVCMREFCKEFIADINRYVNDVRMRRNTPGLAPAMLNLPPCVFKQNIHVSIPAFLLAGCTLSTLSGRIDEGRNPKHVTQMAVWKAIVFDILQPRVPYDGSLEGELTHRDKVYEEALKPGAVPLGSFVFTTDFC